MRKRKLKARTDSAETPPEEHHRRVSTEQLISKFKSMCQSQPETTSRHLVASTTDVLSQYGLPEVPQEEIYDVLGDVLSVCKSPQHSSVERTVKEGTATPVTTKRNLRSRRNDSSSPGKKLQPKSTTMKQRSSTKVGSQHPDNTSAISGPEFEDASVKHKVGTKTECVQHAIVTEDLTLKEKAPTVSPFRPLRGLIVEVERLTSEEIESLCRRRPSPQSPVSKVSQHSGGSESVSPAGKKIRNLRSHATDSANSQCTRKRLAAGSSPVKEEELPDSDETHFDDSALVRKTVQQHSGNASSSRERKGTCDQPPHAAEPADQQHGHNKHADGSESSGLSNQHHKKDDISPLSFLLAPSTLPAPSARSECPTREDSAARCPERRHLESSPVSGASWNAQGNANRLPIKKEACLSGDASHMLDRHRKKGVQELFDKDVTASPSLLASPAQSPSKRLNSVSSKAPSPTPAPKHRVLLQSDEFVKISDTSSQSEPKPEEGMQTSASGQDRVHWQSAQARQGFEAKPTTSRSEAQGSLNTTRIYLSPTRTRPAPVKKSRVRFTALQEEALVYGVMKYGYGSWKCISDEGWFDGRRTAELSDKYRNLEKYGHLPEVRKRVKAMLAEGVNPLKKLRAWNLSMDNPRRVCDRSKQPDVKPEQRRQGLLPNTSAGEKDPTDELGTFADSEKGQGADHEVVPSLDDRAAPKKTPPIPVSPPRQAAASSKVDDGSTGAPSTSSESFVVNDSNSDDSSSEERAKKTKGKSKRVPFTLLEEEALVSGYLKYGKGNWARILREGGFVGRTSIQLSDKFRNLVQYRRLSAITDVVNAKIARGDDPLLEMRKLVAAHWRR